MRLATATTQHRNEPVQRRAFVPIKGPQINPLDLWPAGAEDIKKKELSGDGNADHRRPAGSDLEGWAYARDCWCVRGHDGPGAEPRVSHLPQMSLITKLPRSNSKTTQSPNNRIDE